MPYTLGQTAEEAERIGERTTELINYIGFVMDERYMGQYFTTMTKARLEHLAAVRHDRMARGVWSEADEASWKKRLESSRHKELWRRPHDNPLELTHQERDQMWMLVAGIFTEIKSMAAELIELRTAPLRDGVPIDAVAIIEKRDALLAAADNATSACWFDHGAIREEGLAAMVQAAAYAACLGLEPEHHANYRRFRPLLDASAPLPTLMNHMMGQARGFFAAREDPGGHSLSV